MKKVNKEVFNYNTTRLLEFREYALIPSSSSLFAPPRYVEQLTVIEDVVDRYSGETLSLTRNVSDVHYLLQDNALTPDPVTLRHITESLSKPRPSGLETIDEDIAFDGVVNRYIQRKPELDEFDKSVEAADKSYKEYLDYSKYLSDKNKDKDKNKNKDE